MAEDGCEKMNRLLTATASLGLLACTCRHHKETVPTHPAQSCGLTAERPDAGPPMDTLDSRLQDTHPDIMTDSLNDREPPSSPIEMEGFPEGAIGQHVKREYYEMILHESHREFWKEKIDSMMRYKKVFQRYSRRYGFDPALVMGLVLKESLAKHYCRPKTSKRESRRQRVSRVCKGAAGEIGMMQLMPFHVRSSMRKGIDASTPEGNIMWGVRLLSTCRRQARELAASLGDRKIPQDDLDLLSLHIYNRGGNGMKHTITKAGGARYFDYNGLLEKIGEENKIALYSIRILARRQLIRDYLSQPDVLAYWRDENQRVTDEYRSYLDQTRWALLRRTDVCRQPKTSYDYKVHPIPPQPISWAYPAGD